MGAIAAAVVAMAAAAGGDCGGVAAAAPPAAAAGGGGGAGAGGGGGGSSVPRGRFRAWPGGCRARGARAGSRARVSLLAPRTLSPAEEEAHGGGGGGSRSKRGASSETRTRLPVPEAGARLPRSPGFPPTPPVGGGSGTPDAPSRCFIPNIYAALFTAALIPLVCLVVVFVVFIHAYQVTPQWKAYDDVFRGRTNAAEIPLVLYLFALISITWLWGGLHMAYRHLWILVFFVIFNCLQGLYVFVVYFILHNQLCCPVKASYTVEMNGHTSSGSAFFTHGSGMPSAGAEISKSTQNLIAAMEEMPTDWERASLRPISQTSAVFKQSPQNGSAYTTAGGFSNSSLVADEESQEFDDLIFALKTGAGLHISDTESCHGSQDGSTMVNSQIVELRRIPIADTHL